MSAIVTWLQSPINWTVIIAVLWVVEKVVLISPTKHDDIVVSLIKGFLKKLAGK